MIRVLIAKPGLDGHDKAAKIVTLALRDAGMEVVYSGLHRTVEEIARAAVQEDVDVIGLSLYSGAHVAICRKLRKELPDRPLVVGGVIPEKDHEALRALGVSAICPGGMAMKDVIEAVRRAAEERRG